MFRQAPRAVVFALLLVLAAAGPASATIVSDQPTEHASSVVHGDSPPRFVPSVQPGTNNSTVRHENPEEASESGDLAMVEAHLARLMAARLGRSTIRISQGEYRHGRTLLGEEYAGALAKYVDVAGETPGAGQGDAFESAAENQREFARTLSEYRETMDAYERARENGNERAARRHVRELVRLSDRLSNSSTELTAAYAGVENASGTSLDREERLIVAIAENVTEETEELAEREFLATRLNVTRIDGSGPISFRDPLVVSGRLVTENGSAVADRRVRFAVGERTVTTGTDGRGRFTFTYRPVRLPLDAKRLSIRYRPSAASVYLESNATLPVTVTGTTADVSASGPASASFAEVVTIRGRVVVNGTGVLGAPVRITLGGTTLGTATTNDSGDYELTTTLPAGVPPGERSITASVTGAGRAVGGNGTSAPVMIESTATRLRLHATVIESGRVRVDGTLRTAAGDPIPAQSVELRLAGSTVRDVETGADGSFSARLVVPASLRDEPNATVAAAFSGRGTNLEGASARTTVVLQRGGSGASGSGSGPLDGGDGGSGGRGHGSSVFGLPLRWAIGAALLLALVGVAYALRRGSETPPTTVAGAVTEPTDTAADDDSGSTLLALAAERYADGDVRTAVELAFATVRRRIERRDGLASTLTAREFVEAYTAGSTSDHETLSELAALYEQASFGRGPVSRDVGERALSLARSLLGAGDESDAGSAPFTPDD